MADSLTRHAPAKINLGLHVLQRRSDGYHDVATVMVPIGWQDRLSVQPASSLRFVCSDLGLPTDQRNLCVRAVHALAEHLGAEPHGMLRLDKHVPHGAGLGGGSSDAAHTLRLMADFWEVEVSHDALHTLAAGLGSDVPFFLHDEAMLATGRGEILEPLSTEPYALPFTLVVVMPPVQVSTADAYQWVQPDAADRVDLREVVLSNDPDRWREELSNDFEAPILARYPAVRRVCDSLASAGASYVALSGSGAAVFGVFEDSGVAQATAAAVSEQGLKVWWGGGAGHPSAYLGSSQ